MGIERLPGYDTPNKLYYPKRREFEPINKFAYKIQSERLGDN